MSNKPPYIVQQFGKSPTWIKYFRFKVINEGKIVAKNCQVKLISAEPIGKKLNLPLIEPDKLKWSSAPRDMDFRVDPPNVNSVKDMNQLIPIYREKNDISPKGGSEFCDLFWINTNKKLIFSSTGRRNFEAREGKRYFTKIEISGDNFEPIIKGIRIHTPLKVSYEDNDIKIYLAGVEGVRKISG